MFYLFTKKIQLDHSAQSQFSIELYCCGKNKPYILLPCFCSALKPLFIIPHCFRRGAIYCILFVRCELLLLFYKITVVERYFNNYTVNISATVTR